MLGRIFLAAIAIPAISPARTDGCDNRIHFRNLFEDLERHGALARDNGIVIEAVNVGEVVPFGPRVGFFFGVREVLAVQDDLSPETTASGDFDQGRGLGHHHGHGDF